MRDTDEECDDGLDNSDQLPDACRELCLQPWCGDGVVDVATGETCDDGPSTPTQTCGSTCQVIYCGNGIVEEGKACDDGNTADGDDCSADCHQDMTLCHNGVIDPPEVCDGTNLGGVTCSGLMGSSGGLDPERPVQQNRPGRTLGPGRRRRRERRERRLAAVAVLVRQLKS
ncbi:MAG: hypothetical protein ABI333_06565 [bacterium]